ncbi:MAG: response regulator [Oligoflexales bacterium]|nr:response regulator [Oligoflexales bacterium]
MARNYQITPPRVLILEDEVNNTQLLTEVLESEGYVVESSSNGQVGLDYINSKNFDVVLTDVKMPGLSGMEIIRRSQIASKKPVKFVIISGYLSSQNVTELISLGVKKIFTKPLDLLKFAASLNDFISYHGEAKKQIMVDPNLKEDDEFEVG